MQGYCAITRWRDDHPNHIGVRVAASAGLLCNALFGSAEGLVMGAGSAVFANKGSKMIADTVHQRGGDPDHEYEEITGKVIHSFNQTRTAVARSAAGAFVGLVSPRRERAMAVAISRRIYNVRAEDIERLAGNIARDLAQLAQRAGLIPVARPIG